MHMVELVEAHKATQVETLEAVAVVTQLPE
jgi:hypothetical protein